MVSKTLLLTATIAYVEARFGQEQVPIAAISAVQGGDAGAAATIAGAAISDLLGGANACAKLVRADQIVAELGGGQDAIDAAIGMVTAEKNTNPFVDGNAQKVCDDPTLPATAELRGITPLIDPDVDVNGQVAQLSQDSAAAPLNADGLSVFALLEQNGLGDLVVAQTLDGAAAAGGAADAGNANDNANQNANDNNANQNANQNANADQNADNANQDANADDNAADDAAVECDDGNAAAGNATAGADDNAAADNNAAADDNAAADNNAAAGGNAAADNGAAAGGASSIAGADFGQCTPTIIFEAGQPGRKADEFTFQIADPLARGGQQDALNPNIITNALCNQLTNVCGANDAAIAVCEDAKAQVEAAGTRDKSTADLFNAAVGFAGAVTNPDGGPADVTDVAAANKRAMTFRA